MNQSLRTFAHLFFCSHCSRLIISALLTRRSQVHFAVSFPAATVAAVNTVAAIAGAVATIKATKRIVARAVVFACSGEKGTIAARARVVSRAAAAREAAIAQALACAPVAKSSSRTAAFLCGAIARL